MSKVIVVGHAALDRVYRIAEFPATPTKVRALEHIECGGGMAANAAVAIARLGGQVDLWSRVGSDAAGDTILSALETEGVDIRHVRTIEGARSSTTAIIVDGHGERLIVGERDHAMSLDASWLPLEEIPAAGAVLSDFNWVEAASATFIQAKADEVPTVLDADLGAGARLNAILPLTDYAIFSGPALEAQAGSTTDKERLSAILREHPNLKHAGVTRGARGYTWLSRDGSAGYQPAFETDIVVDTTGAGDAFHGTFAWALACGEHAAAAARLASAAAAIKCGKLGARAGLPTLPELQQLLVDRG
ncbi:MAG: PfkB family carbohydrate kinase [Hyphomicrobium sp.]